VGLSVVFLDVAAYTATGTHSIGPTSYPAGGGPGNALIVYDPGVSGAPKGIANDMASNLAAQGYYVDIAGIKSSTATGNMSQYQVIIVGGPIYGGTAASSVQAYLSNLKPASGTLIGVYGVGSFNTSNDKIAPLPKGSNLTVQETLKINTSQNAATVSSEFVNKLIS
jgi:flavodoxin